jgi:hypothetical protein
MKTAIRFVIVTAVVVAAAVAAVFVATDPLWSTLAKPGARATRLATEQRRPRPDEPRPAEAVPLYSAGFADDSGFDLVTSFMAQDYDRGSLEDHRAAIRSRGPRGIASLQERLAQLSPDLAAADPRTAEARARLEMILGLVHMHEGQFDEAARLFQQARADGRRLPPETRSNLLAMLGVAALRRGEVENCVTCVGASSCIFPIAAEAQHRFPSGSRAAMGYFLDYLKERPEDLGIRWLLNVAAMTLGEYPSGVPGEYLIPLDRFRSPVPMGRFTNIAVEVGLDARGPNMAGGSAFDDFTGDGLPDVFYSSCDWDKGAALFVNRGDRFEEVKASKPGLEGQDMSLNLQAADYDNDGKLDVLLLRGGWEGPARLSLLRNLGGGGFEDVTTAAGLAEPIACQSAAWGDYDNDGKLDVYIVGEYHKDQPDARNLCRLYHNNGNGTFTNVADKAGVTNEEWAKGASWGDYDNDGWPDLYVSNTWGPNRLYRNKGDGTFVDVAEQAGVVDPDRSFSCWFWDYDNDGKLDLFVCGYFARLNDIVADMLCQPASTAERPRLFRNLGNGKFEDVTRAVGLDRVMLPMGTNFADIDNDGFLDMYLGTGQPAYMTLDPSLMFKNVEGRKFVDVTEATGTGHLQKGHGVSFADWDGDGDLDIFVEMGGVATGDQAHNVLFENPGTKPTRHWLDVKLVGVQTNRGAIGTRIQAEIKRSDGSRRSIFRTIGTGSSFGGNCLTAHLGLDQDAQVETLTITWPVSKTHQVFQMIPADQTIEITEGQTQFRRLMRPRPGSVTVGSARGKAR